MEFFGKKIDQIHDELQADQLGALRDTLEFLRPKPCPVPLIRIGGEQDGAYLVPDDLDGITACFSPGVNNFKFFEDELANRFGISSHLCDKTSDVWKFATPLIESKQTFLKKWLGPGDDDSLISLDEWVEQSSPGSDDLILQIDIEGAEYENFMTVSDDVLARFRIIVMELHAVTHLADPNIFEQVLRPTFEKLQRHFTCVHVHPNNAVKRMDPVPGTQMRVPYLLEVTLLRNERFQLLKSDTSHAPELPHPLDISRNADYAPPMFLDRNWLDFPQSKDSQIRQLEIERDYFSAELEKAKSQLSDSHTE